MADVHHETVYFAGHVQGVGFRYATLQVAKEFEVTGRVGNLPDGRVQLDVEGNLRDINAFIAAVEERMHGYIRNLERSSSRTPAQFHDFRIQ
ncbi:MAG: acylphosphatase [Opitutaceae bacterium]|jgi:acylphosphatase